jgi:hypothetical protein
MTRILMIGRHNPVLPPEYFIVKQVSINWSADLRVLERQWNDLKREAQRLNAFPVLQNTPTILLPAIIHDVKEALKAGVDAGIGVIVMETPRRVDASTVKFSSRKRCWHCSQWNKFAAEIVDVANFCDPNHVHEIASDSATVSITVEPRSKMSFSRIDWY